MDARTQPVTTTSPRAAAGLTCVALAMAGAALSGAIIGGASDVAQSPLMPLWASHGGVGAAVAGLLVAAASAALGMAGYRWWRPDAAA